MTKRILLVAVAGLVALVVVLPAAAKTPPPAAVARVGLEVAKLGLAAGPLDPSSTTCKTSSCLSKSYAAFYAQAHTLDGALQALWTAAGKSGACASAVVDAGSGFDSLTANYHSLQAATLKKNKAAAASAYAQIEAKTPRLTAVINSFKTKCR